MTPGEARKLLESCRGEDEPEDYRNLRQLKATFEAVPPGDRVMLNQVIREWLASGDAKDRYDGTWLTDELGLTENLDVIRRLRDEAERRSDPAAPFDWSKYNEIAGRLADRS